MYLLKRKTHFLSTIFREIQEFNEKSYSRANSGNESNAEDNRLCFFFVLSVVFPCMLIITQLLFQQNALVLIKSTKYYNLHFPSLYS
jgi:hypothetical protein